MPEVEDRLDIDQRIRLEALAQAVAQSMGSPMRSAEAVISIAKRFERYIWEGED